MHLYKLGQSLEDRSLTKLKYKEKKEMPNVSENITYLLNFIAQRGIISIKELKEEARSQGWRFGPDTDIVDVLVGFRDLGRLQIKDGYVADVATAPKKQVLSWELAHPLSLNAHVMLEYVNFRGNLPLVQLQDKFVDWESGELERVLAELQEAGFVIESEASTIDWSGIEASV